MNNLFYCPQEKIFAWVAGYVQSDSTDHVAAILDDLTKNAKQFASVAQITFNEVKTTYVYDSQRYRNMRIFYCHVGDDFMIPEDTYQLTNYNIWEWLRD